MENKNTLLIKMLALFMASECYPEVDYSLDEAIDVAEHIVSEINEFKYVDSALPYSSICEILDSYMLPEFFAALFLD